MRWFSQRKGLKKVRREIQIDSIDDALRNRLWNIFLIFYLRPMLGVTWRLENMRTFVTKIWHNYFKLPLNSAPNSYDQIWKEINKYFFECNWHELYTFLELIVAYHPNDETKERFMEVCNAILEEELSAYRFVGGQITEITSEEEISEIEEALETPLKPVRTHLENSLKLLSDRKSPDYRNSIKESISAVEAICRLITKNKKATLGQALKEVETKVGLHGALKKAFSNLYGYTSGAEGIRHALLDESTLSFEDAKFMLVSCSAFINYLVYKAEKAKIEL